MKIKNIILLIVLVALSSFLVSCGSDVKEANEIPTGFIKLSSGGNYPKNSLNYMFEGNQVLFYNADGTCIYQTKKNRSDFIVKFEDEYYINEEKYLELLQLVTDIKVVKNIPTGFFELDSREYFDNGGLHYVIGKTDISFLDSEGNCLYQTKLSNSDFIVIYQYEFFVNRKKYFELVDITTGPVLVQIKPEGFIQLNNALSNLKNGLHCMFFETTISLIDADEISIYDTFTYDYNFIVRYGNTIYVNEKKFLELVEIADAIAEKRNKIYDVGEEIELRDEPYLLKINEVKAGVDGEKEIYTIKYTINPAVTDYQKKKIFDHVETDKGTIINAFNFTGVGEVQVTVPVGEKINMIVVKSPDYSKAIRKISVQ